MKNLFLVLIVFLSLQATAQLSMNSGKYVYHKAHRQSGSGEELYEKAYDWVSKNTDKSKATVSGDREELAFKIIGSYDGEMRGTPAKISYTYTVEFLSGVYRETFTDFVYQSKGRELPYESKKLGGKKAIVHQTTDMIDEMSNNLKSYMDLELSASEK